MLKHHIHIYAQEIIRFEKGQSNWKAKTLGPMKKKTWAQRIISRRNELRVAIWVICCLSSVSQQRINAKVRSLKMIFMNLKCAHTFCGKLNLSVWMEFLMTSFRFYQVTKPSTIEQCGKYHTEQCLWHSHTIWFSVFLCVLHLQPRRKIFHHCEFAKGKWI